jgi:hypothetical protein
MPQRLPSVIRVGPRRYKVTSDRTRMGRLSRTERADLQGFTDHRALTIDIDPNQAPDEKADTLLHEVIHTVTNLTGLNGDWDAETEERVVNRLSPALLDVLRRNPTLVTYLLEES